MVLAVKEKAETILDQKKQERDREALKASSHFSAVHKGSVFRDIDSDMPVEISWAWMGTNFWKKPRKTSSASKNPMNRATSNHPPTWTADGRLESEEVLTNECGIIFFFSLAFLEIA